MALFYTVVQNEIRSLLRERVFFFILAIFIFMSAVSFFIGWLTATTTSSIYNASVLFLHQHGAGQIPPNPLRTSQALSNFRNIIVYMFLIGSLLAVVIGHRSFIREKRAGVFPLLLSRPISSAKLLTGKITGIAVVLFFALFLTFFSNFLTSILFCSQHLGGGDLIRLFLFYALSYFYLLIFTLIGLISAVVAKGESMALFIPVCFWVVISFVLPELVSGQTPTALLNPVTMDQVAPQSGFFSTMQSLLNPISIGWHYTSLSSQLLNASSQQASSVPLTDVFSQNLGSLLVLTAVLSISLFLTYALVHKYLLKMAISYE